MKSNDNYGVTILMPCLNEAETIVQCIEDAKSFIFSSNLPGEVLISDNGSSDASVELALSAGARVISTDIKGYGAALHNGIKNAAYKYVVMGDADHSYDFSSLKEFIEKLENGADLVVGDRFLGGIEKGAMPFLHKYLGNPVLSFIGRLIFNSDIKDFHCGLRSFDRNKILSLGLKTTGMEFASEMIIKAELRGLIIKQTPTVLRPDGRSRAPHLRTWRDGWRHLVFMLSMSPKYLYLFPGTFCFTVGLVGLISLTFLQTNGIVELGKLSFGPGTAQLSSISILMGIQLVYVWVAVRTLAQKTNVLPMSKAINFIYSKVGFNVQFVSGLLLLLLGTTSGILAAFEWLHSTRDINGNYHIRLAWASTFVFSSFQVLLGSFITLYLKPDNSSH